MLAGGLPPTDSSVIRPRDSVWSPAAVFICVLYANPCSTPQIARQQLLIEKTATFGYLGVAAGFLSGARDKLRQVHFERVLTTGSVSAGHAHEEQAAILQDSEIVYLRKAIPEGQGAGRAAGQFTFAVNGAWSVSKLKCFRRLHG